MSGGTRDPTRNSPEFPRRVPFTAHVVLSFDFLVQFSSEELLYRATDSRSFRSEPASWASDLSTLLPV